MSEMSLHRSHPFPVVEGSAIGIIPNPMSGKDIRRIISQASVFSNTEKASMVLRILRTVGTLGVERVLLSTDTFGIAASVQREIKRMSGARSTTHIRWPKVEFLTLERSTGTAADTPVRIAQDRRAEDFLRAAEAIGRRVGREGSGFAMHASPEPLSANKTETEG